MLASVANKNTFSKPGVNGHYQHSRQRTHLSFTGHQLLQGLHFCGGGRLINWRTGEGRETGNITMPIGILTTSITHSVSATDIILFF